jgi:hypothetical protein
MPANDRPLTASAGQTSIVSRQPTMPRTSQNGRIAEIGGRIRPVMALSAGSGSAVTAARTRIGLPTAPQATGAVLAIKQRVAAWNGSKPSPIKNDPAIATGAPPPPVPSRNAPKQNAIRSRCSRLSVDNAAIDSFITWNWPVSTAMLYRKIEATMIQAMRNRPKTTPSPPAAATIAAGIPKTPKASATAINSPSKAATQTRAFKTTSAKKSVTTGNADTSVDHRQSWSGS